jgi:hypothetical protein
VKIDMARVGTRGHLIPRRAHRAQNAPRAVADEIFARNRCKRFHDGGAANGPRSGAPRLTLPRHCNRIGTRLAPRRTGARFGARYREPRTDRAGHSPDTMLVFSRIVVKFRQTFDGPCGHFSRHSGV